MTSSGDPHAIEEKLEATEQYQAPAGESGEEQVDPVTDGGGQSPDVNLLEAQRKGPGVRFSETTVTEPGAAPITVSGPDEQSDEPGAVPPGETM